MLSPSSFPWKLAISLVPSLILDRQRSFRADAIRAVGSLQPPLRVVGEAFIPKTGPYLVTINHYSRPGFGAWWLSLAVSAALPEPVQWVITAYWRFENHPLRPWLSPLSRWTLARVARVYCFITMPALPPDPSETLARAAAVRRIFALSKAPEPLSIGLAPEGRDSSQPGLAVPLPGVGRLIERLIGSGYVILPAAIYEQEGLVVHFGEPYSPTPLSEGSRGDKDLFMRQVVMAHIADLLPEALQGEYKKSPEMAGGV